MDVQAVERKQLTEVRGGISAGEMSAALRAVCAALDGVRYEPLTLEIKAELRGPHIMLFATGVPN